MTRRKFIRKLVGAGSAILAGGLWLAKKAVPRKFVRGAGLGKYPGSLKDLGDIDNQGKWSG